MAEIKIVIVLMNQDLSHFTTYRTAIWQASAYRNLQHFMSRTLKPFNITCTQWSILGLIAENSQFNALTSTDIALLLDVDKSFVSNSTKYLTAMDLIRSVTEPDDRRVKRLVVSKKGSKITQSIEAHIRKEMRLWLKDVEDTDLLKYIKVIKQLNDMSMKLVN